MKIVNKIFIFESLAVKNIVDYLLNDDAWRL